MGQRSDPRPAYCRTGMLSTVNPNDAAADESIIERRRRAELVFFETLFDVAPDYGDPQRDQLVADWMGGVRAGLRAIEYISKATAGRQAQVIDSLASEYTIEKLNEIIVTEAERNQQSQEEGAGSKRPFAQIMGELTFLAAMQESLREEEDRLVAEARENGVTWSEIGRYFGITPQSAYQRWSETGREKHRDYQRKLRRQGKSEESDKP
jgi:hypothetical protein